MKPDHLIRHAVRLFALAMLLVSQAVHAADTASNESLWSALQSGGYIVLIRHAETEPGTGDPPGFVLDNCSTQRNLSAEGRSHAQRLGEAFRKQRIPVADVLSSRWCRCIDTARLAFGTARPAAMLDSMFDDDDDRIQAKVRAVSAAARERPAAGNRIWVTHNVNIRTLTGISPGAGEMVIVSAQKDGTLKPVGRLTVPR
ncbi:histidine phosphatase family protein [Noviherbaspirillum massiliense]|uniref:histidine phosphatase family protein n=1 Tax=Noviherbaspirillum massiliense TaxID=1465823 RepID=UPI00030BB825|nr:histidine phosphatase family protein [Noviherbaspirillum massiliense]